MNVTLFDRINFQTKLLFTKHLETMVKSGIPIPEALETLREQTSSPRFKSVIKKVETDIDNGKPMSKALEEIPDVFDKLYINLIKVGEESGTLEESLSFLAKQMGKDYALRKKVKSALMYPAIVVGAIVVMGTFISLFILPRLVEFFESFDIDLPLSTRILLFVSTLFRDHGLVVFGLAIFSVVVTFFVTRIEKVRPYRDTFILKIPFVGKMVQYGQLARFSRNLGTLTKSGVPISASLLVTANTLTNERFKIDLLEVSEMLKQGKGIGDSLQKKNFSEYPPLVYRMIKIGEKTGTLDDNLIYLSEFYEDEIEELSKNISTIIEPVLLIIIGLAVGFIALSIISPIYELTGSIRR